MFQSDETRDFKRAFSAWAGKRGINPTLRSMILKYLNTKMAKKSSSSNSGDIQSKQTLYNRFSSIKWN
jgi:hypothetical protein